MACRADPLMFVVLVLAEAASLVTLAAADPPAATRARVAVALAAAPTPADPDRVARVAAALEDACRCASARVLPWPEARAKALKDGGVLVGFFGGAEVRCCSDAVPGTAADVPAGFGTDKPVVVFAASAGGLRVVKELPRDAPAAAVKAAVAEAKKVR